MLWGLVEVYSNLPPAPNSSSTNLLLLSEGKEKKRREEYSHRLPNIARK